MIGRRGNPWLATYVIAGVMLLYAPIAILFLFSFNQTHYLAFPITGLTFDWYSRMSENAGLFNSLQVGWVASAVATFELLHAWLVGPCDSLDTSTP